MYPNEECECFTLAEPVLKIFTSRTTEGGTKKERVDEWGEWRCKRCGNQICMLLGGPFLPLANKEMSK